MNKIDKFLYGGFAVVAFVGIVAMLVSIFSLPKQTTEETDKTPMTQNEQPTMETASTVAEETTPAEAPYYYIDESGNKVWLTQEEFDAGSEYEQEQKRKEAERLAKEKAEKEWWESRQDWIERFPFQPTHHSEVTYDSDAFHAGGEMLDLAKNHSFLRYFYENRLRYTKEFEKLYDIVQEEVEEKANNPIILGWTFNALRKYHHAKAQAPDAIYRKNARVYRPQLPPKPPDMLAGLTPQQRAAYLALPGSERRAMTKELRASQSEEYVERLRAYNRTPRYQTVDITWGEEAESLKRCIIGALCDRSWMSQEQARAIRERLLNEIPAEGFSKMPEVPFAYVHQYYANLQDGDPLLVK